MKNHWRIGMSAAAIAAIAGYALWWHLSPANPWRLLYARYPATRGWGEFRQQRTLELRSGRGVAVSRFPQRVTVEWRESSLFLGQSVLFLGRRVDLDLVFPPIQIPAGAIRGCRITTISADRGVEFWVEDAGIRVGFPGYGDSYDRDLVEGCRARGIPVQEEAAPPPPSVPGS